VTRDVFVPVPGFEAVQLPGGWSVRAYAPSGTVNDEWYEGTYAGAENQGNWVFPETGFFDIDDGAEGPDRQTFMIRFEGGTGMLKVSDPAAALVFSPSPSAVFRTGGIWASFRADRAADGVRFVRRVLSSPDNVLPLSDKQELLGDQSSDTVLARAVGQVAAYHERTLAASIRARLDRVTNSLYQPASVGKPMLGSDVKVDDINKWIEGTLVVGAKPVDTDARVFSVQRYLGWLQEMPQPEQSNP
jgi:hypothetical protein